MDDVPVRSDVVTAHTAPTTAHAASVKAYIQDATSHTVPLTVHKVTLTAHIEDVIAHASTNNSISALNSPHVGCN